MRFSTLVASVFSCAAALAAPSSTPPIARLDLKCSKGYTFGYHNFVMQFSTPPHKVMDAFGSFFDMGFFGIPTTNHGEDNTPGATRSAPYGGGNFIDLLTYYHRTDSDSVIMVWTSVHPVTFRVPEAPERGSLTYEKYTEHLEITSLCGGTATKIYFPGVSCIKEDQVDRVYDLEIRAKYTVLDVAWKLGADILPEGKCPTKKRY